MHADFRRGMVTRQRRKFARSPYAALARFWDDDQCVPQRLAAEIRKPIASRRLTNALLTDCFVQSAAFAISLSDSDLLSPGLSRKSNASIRAPTAASCPC